ncbi:hypothetical protein D3C86_1390720 [compost metagenome]
MRTEAQFRSQPRGLARLVDLCPGGIEAVVNDANLIRLAAGLDESPARFFGIDSHQLGEKARKCQRSPTVGGAESGIGDDIVQNPDERATAELRGQRADKKRLLRVGADHIIMPRLPAQLPGDRHHISRSAQQGADGCIAADRQHFFSGRQHDRRPPGVSQIICGRTTTEKTSAPGMRSSLDEISQKKFGAALLSGMADKKSGCHAVSPAVGENPRCVWS